MRFVCKFLDEMVILSDGRCSTCCMDPLGENAYTSIFEEDYRAGLERRLALAQQIMDDPYSVPRCARCLASQGVTRTEHAGNGPMRFCDQETAQRAAESLVKGPERAVIELSSICNLKCRGCMQYRFDIPSTRARPLLDVDQLMRWLSDCANQIKRIRLYNYGETFVHPRAIEVVEFLKKQGMFVEIATNGMLLDNEDKQQRLIASGVDRLLFSIHGSSQDSVEPYMTRAFDFEKILGILENLDRFRDSLGAGVEIVWKYLLFEWNDTDEDLERAESLARERGVDKLHFTLPGSPSPSKRFECRPNSNYKVIDLRARSRP